LCHRKLRTCLNASWESQSNSQNEEVARTVETPPDVGSAVKPGGSRRTSRSRSCCGSHLSVRRVPFLMSVRDYLSRSGPRVQITKTTITAEYVTQMVARLECGVLAVPVDGASADVYHGAPGGIARGMAWRSSKPCRYQKRGDTNCEGFCHDDPSLFSGICMNEMSAELAAH
jgi:hypothetical protein